MSANVPADVASSRKVWEACLAQLDQWVEGPGNPVRSQAMADDSDRTTTATPPEAKLYTGLPRYAD